MAKVKSRRFFWDPPADTDIVGYNVYVDDAARPNFLADVDAGTITPRETVPTTEWIVGPGDLPEGTYQVAVTSVDDATNESDPYQHPAWVSVPLDLTAPGAPSGGGLEII